jgi:hypothetical protein
MPVAVSWIMRLVPLPLLTGVQLPEPEILATLTKLTLVGRLSRILTSYRGTSTGVSGTVMV